MASIEERLELLRILADELRSEISDCLLGTRIEELLEELDASIHSGELLGISG